MLSQDKKGSAEDELVKQTATVELKERSRKPRIDIGIRLRFHRGRITDRTTVDIGYDSVDSILGCEPVVSFAE